MRLANNIKLTGIILAGGKGIRLGRNKGMAMLRDRHLIEYVIENLSAICDEILISSNSKQCEKFGFKTIPDHYMAKGPMAGIHACLRASSNEHNFVVSVDTPFVSPGFINYIFEQRKNKLIAAPWYRDDHFEPLCAYYNRQAFELMEEFFEKGNYKLPDLFKAIPFAAVKIDETMPHYHPMLFHNINTEEDLAAAESFMEKNDLYGK